MAAVAGGEALGIHPWASEHPAEAQKRPNLGLK